MRIVFFTGEGYGENELFRYIFAHIASRWGIFHVVAIRGGVQRTFVSNLRRYWHKVKRVGLLYTLEILTSYPIAYIFRKSGQSKIDSLLRELPRPPIEPVKQKVIWVNSVNGPDAVGAIGQLQPDVILQCGAGILRSQIFNLARLGALNMHHGIAPLIKGMSSIKWALWERKPEWIGTTVHLIDEGIDTGNVLAYAPIEAQFLGERWLSLYVRATQKGVERLVEVLARLEAGEKWAVEPPQGDRVYRTTMSGWRQLAMETRLAWQRYRKSEGPR